MLSGVTVLSGGVALVAAGGSALALDVAAGGTEIVSAGGTFAGVTLSGGAVYLLSGAAGTGTIGFAGSGGSLVVSGAFPAGDGLSGFVAGSGDDVLFGGITYEPGAEASFAGGFITVSVGGTSFDIADPTGAAGTPFTIVDDGGRAELIPCFVAGTRILTPCGEVAVEALAVGDTVVTVREGGPATARIVWVGSRTLDAARHADPALVRPVRFRAGALGGGIPERDVRLSPHHAVYLDGALIEAIALVNGMTIIQEAATDLVTYHHIELERHDILLAEGMPAESFLDIGNKHMFAQAGAPLALHPDWRTPPGAATCVPLHRGGALVARVRARLETMARAGGRQIARAAGAAGSSPS